MSPRAAITSIFVLDGIALGGWGARVPAVQDHAGVGPGGLAVVLAALAAGALLAMPPAGRVASRAGSRRTVAAAVVALGLVLPLPALVPGLAAVAVTAFLLGAVNGTLDVAMNAQGVAVERRGGRPILSSLHAGFSFGGLLGAGAGALAATRPPGRRAVRRDRRRWSPSAARSRVAGCSTTDPWRPRPLARAADGAGALAAARPGLLLPVRRGRGGGLERRASARDRRGRRRLGAGLCRLLADDDGRAPGRRRAQPALGRRAPRPPRRAARGRRAGGRAGDRAAVDGAGRLPRARRRAGGRSCR